MRFEAGTATKKRGHVQAVLGGINETRRADLVPDKAICDRALEMEIGPGNSLAVPRVRRVGQLTISRRGDAHTA